MSYSRGSLPLLEIKVWIWTQNTLAHLGKCHVTMGAENGTIPVERHPVLPAAGLAGISRDALFSRAL